MAGRITRGAVAKPLRTLLWGLTLSGAALPAAAGTLAIAPADEPIAPIPATIELDPAKVRLGEQLFRDPRLSHADRIACVACHQLDRGGEDGQAHSLGTDGQPLDFNTPTVFNAALSFRLDWRGDFRTLEEQADGALHEAPVMATRWDEVLSKLRADPGYQEAFRAAYGGPPAKPQVLDALATFERSLITPDAPLDRYLRGERGAISPEEEQGYELFKSYGCIACHQGVGVGGNLFQRFGVFADPFADRPLTRADLGRLTLTGKAKDRFVFRVPSLRNVAVTAPYFHDGSAATLEQAVDKMARTQLGRVIEPEEIELIVAFLHTLTGKYRGRPLTDHADAQP